MKNLGLLLNGVLAVAVIGLYILHFNQSPSSSVASDGTIKSKGDGSAISFETVGGENNIAVVYLDSLLLGLDMYNDLGQSFREDQMRAESELNARVTKFQKDAQDFQYKQQKGLITTKTAQELAAKLAQEEQAIMQQQQQSRVELAQQEQVMTAQVFEEITQYIKELNAEGKYDFIMSTTNGAPLLYASKSSDITTLVLEGVNARYAASKDKE